MRFFPFFATDQWDSPKKSKALGSENNARTPLPPPRTPYRVLSLFPTRLRGPLSDTVSPPTPPQFVSACYGFFSFSFSYLPRRAPSFPATLPHERAPLRLYTWFLFRTLSSFRASFPIPSQFSKTGPVDNAWSPPTPGVPKTSLFH